MLPSRGQTLKLT